MSEREGGGFTLAEFRGVILKKGRGAVTGEDSLLGRVTAAAEEPLVCQREVQSDALPARAAQCLERALPRA